MERMFGCLKGKHLLEELLKMREEERKREEEDLRELEKHFRGCRNVLFVK